MQGKYDSSMVLGLTRQYMQGKYDSTITIATQNSREAFRGRMIKEKASNPYALVRNHLQNLSNLRRVIQGTYAIFLFINPGVA